MKNIVLFILRFAPVFIGSHSGGFLEYTSEVLRVLETELIGYLTDIGPGMFRNGLECRGGHPDG